MPFVGFEPTLSAGERPQTYALDRTTTETGSGHSVKVLIFLNTSGAQNLTRKMEVETAHSGVLYSRINRSQTLVVFQVKIFLYQLIQNLIVIRNCL
jgi:hypothetical protein